MKKNTIIDIIDNDLKEIQLLLNSFRQSDYIHQDFINLLSEKHAAVAKEIGLLGHWAEQTQPKTDDVQPAEAPADNAAPVVEEQNIAPVAAEPEPVAPEVQPEPEQQIEPQVVEPVAEVEVPTPEPVVEKPAEVASPKAEAPVQHTNSANYANDVKQYGLPVDDVCKAFGIADRFFLQRELFGNDSAQFKTVTDTINACHSFGEAHQYLMQAYQWDETDPTVEAFMRAVHRRFINS